MLKDRLISTRTHKHCALSGPRDLPLLFANAYQSIIHTLLITLCGNYGNSMKICNCNFLQFQFLADRILMASYLSSVCPSVCPSICDAVHCGIRVGVGVESCAIVFLGRHFLFTSSGTFSVGCITQPQHTAKNRIGETSASGISIPAEWPCGQCHGYSRRDIFGSSICSYTVRRTQHDRPS